VCQYVTERVAVYVCCTALHCTALHCTALHCTALHCIAGCRPCLPGHYPTGRLAGNAGQPAVQCSAVQCSVVHCNVVQSTSQCPGQSSVWSHMSGHQNTFPPHAHGRRHTAVSLYYPPIPPQREQHSYSVSRWRCIACPAWPVYRPPGAAWKAPSIATPEHPVPGPGSLARVPGGPRFMIQLVGDISNCNAISHITIYIEHFEVTLLCLC
jgi:hypothetical protein